MTTMWAQPLAMPRCLMAKHRRRAAGYIKMLLGRLEAKLAAHVMTGHMCTCA